MHPLPPKMDSSKGVAGPESRTRGRKGGGGGGHGIAKKNFDITDFVHQSGQKW